MKQINSKVELLSYLACVIIGCACFLFLKIAGFIRRYILIQYVKDL